MPWPVADFDAYVKKASKDPVLAKHPYRDELLPRFAEQLEHGTALFLPECMSKACARRWPGFGRWVGWHTPAELASHVMTAEDAEFTSRKARETKRRWHRVVLELIARWDMGEWRPGRRGDLIVMRTRRRTWLGYRTK